MEEIDELMLKHSIEVMPDYGEPWQKFNLPNGDDYGRSDECLVGRNGAIMLNDMSGATPLERVASCVNACRGIKDPETVVPLLVAAAVSMLKYAKDKTFYPMMEECQFVEHLTKLSVAIAALQPKREGSE